MSIAKAPMNNKSSDLIEPGAAISYSHPENGNRAVLVRSVNREPEFAALCGQNWEITDYYGDVWEVMIREGEAQSVRILNGDYGLAHDVTRITNCKRGACRLR